MAGLTMAVSLGWLRLDEAQMQAVQGFILPLAGLLLPILAALWARGKVTPVDDPRTESGEPAAIVPAEMVTPVQMAAMAEREVLR